MPDTNSRTRSTSGLAFVALGCAVVWVFGLGSVLAIVLGHLARRRIRKRHQRGAWAATAALVLGYLGLAMVIFMLLQGGVTIEENVPS